METTEVEHSVEHFAEPEVPKMSLQKGARVPLQMVYQEQEFTKFRTHE